MANTCHIEDHGSRGARVVTHDRLAPVWAPTMEDAYLLASENGWSVSYVRSMRPADPLVVLS